MNGIEALNAATAAERLAALKSLDVPESGNEFEDVNNHIHTCYSFSPYSPTKAVYMSKSSGLRTTGIVDHDSVAGVREFIEAGEILKFPTTSGFEMRTTHSHTSLSDKRTNNPDQGGITYLTFHGLPHTRIDAFTEYLKPVCRARGERNRVICDNINALFSEISLDYDADVLPLSKAAEGGSVTERHILFALARKLMAAYGRGESLAERLAAVSPSLADTAAVKLLSVVANESNPHYEYDLLGLLKSGLVESIYAPAGEVECPPIEEAVRFAHENGIIATYPYLGDVGVSVTGDKKPQKFEDDFLEELFEFLSGIGIRAVSYMPSRNTAEQLQRLRALCDRYDMLQISGEDINTPRQKFICEKMHDPEFENLIESTWALIGHELAATKDIKDGFIFTEGTLKEKIDHFKEIGYSQYK